MRNSHRSLARPHDCGRNQLEMALPEISNDEHSRLLYHLSNRAFTDDEMKQIEQQLRDLIGIYNNLLIDLYQIVEQYKQVASKIK
jgi:hypothetical protein